MANIVTFENCQTIREKVRRVEILKNIPRVILTNSII